jgi:hypothetical protein
VAIVGPNPRSGLMYRIRHSEPGDLIELNLSDDGHAIVSWVNKTHEERISEFWKDWQCGGECDD